MRPNPVLAHGGDGTVHLLHKGQAGIPSQGFNNVSPPHQVDGNKVEATFEPGQTTFTAMPGFLSWYGPAPEDKVADLQDRILRGNKNQKKKDSILQKPTSLLWARF